MIALVGACEPSRLNGPDGGPREASIDAVLTNDLGAAMPDARMRSGDAGRRPADPPGDDTIELVMRWASLALEEPDGSGIAPGFDVDGIVTGRADPTGCGQEDFIAPARQGSGDGIDNQIVPLYGVVRSASPDSDFDEDLVNAVTSGDAIILFRISHVGDLVNDGEVEVSVMTGAVPGGGEPRLETTMIDGMPRRVLTADQSFDVEPSSLIGGRARALFDDAYIVDGRLLTRGTSFSLRVPATDGRVLVLDLRDMRIDAHVTPTGLELGVLGGYVLQEDLARGVASALRPDDPVSPELVMTVLETYADIDLDEDGVCEGLSAALRIDAVHARFVYPAP